MAYSLPDLFYYVLLAACFSISLAAPRTFIRGLLYIRILLGISLFGEMANEYLVPKGEYQNLFYYLYIPLEFVLLSLFFLQQSLKRVWINIVGALIFLYVAGFVIAVVFRSSYRDIPTFFYTITGTVMICYAAISLMLVQPLKELPLQRVPVFWIHAGIITFFACILMFSGVYNKMRAADAVVAERLRLYINITANYLLYSSWLYAFICSIRLKKYTFL